MADVLLVSAAGALYAQSTSTSYAPIGVAYNGATPNTTETNTQIIQRTAGVFSKLSINCTTHTSSTVIQLRKDGVTQTTPTVTAAGTGLTTDSTNTATVSAGEKWNFILSNLASTFSLFSVVFAANTNTACRLVTYSNAAITPSSAANFTTLMGKMVSGLLTNGNAQITIQKTGTFTNLAVNVPTNNQAVSAAVQLIKGASTVGNCTIDLHVQTTGILEDTTHSDTVTAADLWCIKYLTATGATFLSTAIDYTTTTGDSIQGCGNASAALYAKSVTKNFALGGEIIAQTNTEAQVQDTVQDIYLYSNTYANCKTFVSAETVALRANAGAAGSISISIAGTGNTGDTTHTYTAATTDNMNFQLVTGSTTGNRAYTAFWTHANLVTGPKTASFTEAIGSITDSLNKLAALKRTDVAVTVTDATVRLKIKPRTLSETAITVTDSSKKKAVHGKTEALTVTESLKKKALLKRTEALGLVTDAIAKLRKAPKALTTDALGLITDALKKLAVHKRTEALGSVTETLPKKASHTRIEAIGSITDALKKLAIHSRTEALGAVTDSLKKKAIHALTEALGTIADSLASNKISGGGHLFTRALADTLVLTDAIKKKATHGLAEALSAIDALVKKALLKRALATEALGTVTEALAKSRHQFRTLTTEALGTITDPIKRRIGRKLTTEAIGLVTDSLKKIALHAQTEVLGAIIAATTGFKITKQIVDSLVALKISTHIHTISIIEILGSVTDAANKKAALKMTESLTLSDALAKVKRVFTALTEGPFSISDSLKKKATKFFSQPVSLTDSLVKRAAHVLASPLGAVAESLSKKAKHSIAEASLSITDVVRKRASHSISEATLSVTEVVRKLAVHTRTETIGLITDSIAKTKKEIRALTEALGAITNPLKKKAAHFKTETLGLVGDVLGRTALHKRVLVEALGLITDQIKKKSLRVLAQNVGVATDALVKKAAKSIHDIAISVSDALVSAAVHGRNILIVEPSLAISAVFTWAYSTQQILEGFKKRVLHVIGEPVSFGESFAKSGQKVRSIADSSISITDSLLAIAPIFKRALADTLTLLESIKKKAFLKRSESVSLSELTVKIRRVPRTAADTVPSPTDSLRKKALKSISEFLGILEAIQKKASHQIAQPVSPLSDILRKLAMPKAFVQPLGAITDSMKKRASKSLVEVVMISEILRKGALHKLVEALSVSEILSKSKVRLGAMIDTLLVSEAIVRKKKGIKAFSDILILSESRTKQAFHQMAESVLFLPDVMGKHHRFVRSVADLLTVSEFVGHFHRFTFRFRETLGGPGFGGALRRHFGGKRPMYGTREP